jgi:signal transduction histidine kinase/DNA-binding response OmpR family regulator/ligand-binding sensor domain-containing protein
MNTRAAFCLLLLAVALQLYTNIFAQERLLPVYNFKKVEGLSSHEIRARVVRDHQGYIWIGTVNGLNRYDGYGVKEYRHDPDDPHSISSNYIRSLLVDSQNRLWVGTFETGFSLYDASRDRFINFLPRPGDSTWYESTIIPRMLEDRSGNIWLGGYGIVRVTMPAATASQELGSVASGIQFTPYPGERFYHWSHSFLQREDGTILASGTSGLFILDPESNTFSRPRFSDPVGRRLDTLNVTCLFQDSHGNTWLGSYNHQGVFKIDWHTKQVWNFRHQEGMASNLVWDLAEDWQGNIWIGTEGGVFHLSPVTGHYLPYLTFGTQLNILSSCTSMSVDRTGTLWIGLYGGGLHWLSRKAQRFPPYRIPNGPDLSPISFTTVEMGKKGTIWLLSAKGMLYQVDLTTLNIVKTIDVFKGKTPTSGICDSFIDAHGTYWYGAWGLGLFRVDLISGKVKNYDPRAGLDWPIVEVQHITQGLGDSLLVATYLGHLMKFDPGSERFIKVPDIYYRVYAVMRDRLGKIWITTEYDGIVILDPLSGKKEHLLHNPANASSLSSDRVRYTYQDAASRIWVGAGTIIDLWDPATRSFTHYPNPEFNKALFADPMGSDSTGRIWVRFVGCGVSVLNPATGIYTNFGNTDGFDSYISDMKTLPDGRVILVGEGGMNIFNPDSIMRSWSQPPLLLTRMAINDEPVVPPTPGEGLNLSYAQNVLEFEFAAIDIDAPQLVQYQYQLEGLEEDWVQPENRRYVRYPGLDPGDYIFKVKAASIRQEWPAQELILAITIAPPWYRTTWAYGIYLIIVIGLLYGGYRLRLRQVQLKQQVVMEHFQAEHLAEVDKLKSRFFANISHEFRTPLTLIIGPVKEMLSRDLSADIKQQFKIIIRNGERLLQLINQLLDLSKLESGRMKLRVSRTDIMPLLKGLVYSFASLAERKKIMLKFKVKEKALIGYIDQDKLEKIITNLLSNAFKFTPEGGEVEVFLSREPTPSLPHQVRDRLSQEGKTVTPLLGGDTGVGINHSKLLKITISNTGPGIPKDQLQRIFDRFYQVDDGYQKDGEGTGIGLALTKELVEVCHGEINVKSEKIGEYERELQPPKSSPPEAGKLFIKGDLFLTTFTIWLPIGKEHLKPEEIMEITPQISPLGKGGLRGVSDTVPIPEKEDSPLKKGARGLSKRYHDNIPDEEISAEPIIQPSRSTASGLRSPLLLIVEDNPDVTNYIRGFLQKEYLIIAAKEGQVGWQKTLKHYPDLIISDVMMPVMDGFALCRKVKSDQRTSHIPVILLTAKADIESKIDGLEFGADAYVTKPFEARELQVRVKNLIAQRKKLREKFSRMVEVEPDEIAATSMDKQFLARMLEVFETHVAESDFSTEDFAREVGMSRTHLYRKLQAITNQPTGEFLRSLRLKRAAQLLKKSAGTITEVAYAVGFSNLSYFSRTFRKHFGQLPKDFAKSNQ